MPVSTQKILTDLASVIGWEATATIVRFIGGQCRKIPLKASDEHWLVAFIGREKADLLCQRYGGDTIWVPKNDGGLREIRDARIRALRTEGATINALAHEFHLTDRQIYNVLAQQLEEG